MRSPSSFSSIICAASKKRLRASAFQPAAAFSRGAGRTTTHERPADGFDRLREAAGEGSAAAAGAREEDERGKVDALAAVAGRVHGLERAEYVDLRGLWVVVVKRPSLSAGAGTASGGRRGWPGRTWSSLSSRSGDQSVQQTRRRSEQTMKRRIASGWNVSSTDFSLSVSFMSGRGACGRAGVSEAREFVGGEAQNGNATDP